MKKSIRLKPRIKKILSRCWIYFGILLVVMTIIFSVFRALTPWARQYKTEVEKYLSQVVGQPVSVNSMETGWYWFRPVLRLDEVSITGKGNEALHVGKLLVGFNLISSILHRQVQPGILFVEDTHLILRQTEPSWSVDGLVLNGQAVSLEKDTYLPILAWLSTWDKVVVRRSSIVVHLKNGKVIPIKRLNLVIQNRGGHYRIKGRAVDYTSTPTKVSILADMQLSLLHLEQAKGRIYFAVDSFVPAEWQSYIPYHFPARIMKGKGSVKLWVDLNKAHLTGIQSILHFDSILLQQDTLKRPIALDSFGLNLGWRKTREGWEINGTHVNLELNQLAWPENSFFVHFDKSQNAFHVYLKHVLIDGIRSLAVAWPKEIQSMIATKPRGALSDLEFVLKGKEFDYLLMGFSDLGWKQNGNKPSVSGLSGALYWRPTEGRLQLNSQNAVIKQNQSAPVSFSLINTVLKWKPNANGTQLNIENFVIQNSNLDFTANGVIEDLKNAPRVQLNAKFAANNAEQLLRYIPPKSLKPKLESWLKENIRHIEHANGKIALNGNWADFPFDRTDGAFSLVTNIQGLDLSFTSKWPVTHDIEALLQVDKRNLKADILHANIGGIAVDKLNLNIQDLGSDYETLLLHSELDAEAKPIFSYLLNTPLKQPLSRLKTFEIEGSLGLDLSLEIPLYPESDTVLTRGSVKLTDNNTILHQADTSILLGTLNGKVNFDENGLTKSELTSKGSDSLFTIHIEPIKTSRPTTRIELSGKTSIDGLQKMLHLPGYSFIKGPLELNGYFSMSNADNVPDSLQLYSSLQGVSVDLSEPLGKPSDSIAPLSAYFEFHDEKMKRVKVNYKPNADEIVLDAHPLENDEWAFALQQKDITAALRYQASTRSISGDISRLHIPSFSNNKNAFSEKAKHLSPEDIPNLDITVQNLIYDDLNLGKMKIEGLSQKNTWRLNNLLIGTPTYTFNMKGEWKKEGESNQTEMEGAFQTTNLGKTLESWHMEPLVEAKKGDVRVRAKWSGGLFDFALNKLNGQMEAVFKDGRVKDLSKSTEKMLGFGKLLSILSLQTLPRRLKLDFSDLAHSGYTFDQFKGDFTIKKGVMTTENSTVDGPVALIEMKGDISLVKHLLNMSLHVSPHVMTSLPVVATIAGGPIVGIATWVASKIITEGMYKVTGYTYDVSGEWKDPIVKQTNIYKHLLPPARLPASQ